MGTVISGKIESGKIKKGSTVLIMPLNRKVEIITIYCEENEVNVAVCGDNVRIRIKNVEEEVYKINNNIFRNYLLDSFYVM